MKQLLITIALLVVALPTTAAEKGLFNLIEQDGSSSGWFMSSQSKSAKQFDVWQIDSGYAYALSDNTELYLSTRLKTGNQSQAATRGLLSGVKYSLSSKISLKSALTSETVERDTVMGVEVSSQYEVTDQVNLHATVDYEALEQLYQLGIGFRF